MLRSQIKSTARTLAVLLPIACAGLLVSRIPKAENLILATAHADDVTSRTASLPPAYGVTLKKGQITFTRGVPKPDEGTRLLLHFEEPASEPEVEASAEETMVDAAPAAEEEAPAEEQAGQAAEESSEEAAEEGGDEEEGGEDDEEEEED